jgi:hypothetical protein
MRRAALILTVTEAAMLWASTALAQTAPAVRTPRGAAGRTVGALGARAPQPR